MIEILNGDARNIPLASGTVQCVVTSPPYWGLRDYGTGHWEGGDPACDHVEQRIRTRRNLAAAANACDGGNQNQGNRADDGEATALQFRGVCGKCGARRVDAQIGMEETPEGYVRDLVEVFREVRRVLRPDGVMWLNLGDSYARNGGEPGGKNRELLRMEGKQKRMLSIPDATGLKAKDLVGIPWMVAFALRADGWYLRSEIIWYKPNPMPESVTDRPTKAHEQVFLLTQSERYFYDADAIMEPISSNTYARISQDLANQVGSFRAHGGGKTNGPMKAVIRGSTRKLAEAGSGIKANESFEAACVLEVASRNRRSVWTIPTQSYNGAHFATFPEKLVEPCILAGTSAKGACPRCGAPWVRVVDRVVLPPADRKHNNEFKHDAMTTHGEGKSTLRDRVVRVPHDGATETAYEEGTNANRIALLRQAARERGGEYVNERETVGWEPGCDCDAGEPVPCIVMDPFAGTGTVGRVCARLGRRFVGIELKADYVELASERTSGVQVMLGL